MCAPFPHHCDKLIEVDSAIVIGIVLREPYVRLGVCEPVPKLCQHKHKLVAGQAAIAVLIEDAESLPQPICWHIYCAAGTASSVCACGLYV